MLGKILLSSGLIIGIFIMVVNGTAKHGDAETVPNTFDPIVVLELFTSQGCSSCPLADTLLDHAKKQYPDLVVPLSYHVDYWNYIGWEDPFSHPGYSRKQGRYNAKFNYSGNYTPEMVINGQEHFVGSHAAKLNEKINVYRKVPAANKITLANVSRKKDHVTFNYQIDGNLEDKLMRVVLVLDERTTVVKRGENRNRTLKNSNIVVREAYLDLAAEKGTASIEIPALVREGESLQLITLLETDDLDIIAATKKQL